MDLYILRHGKAEPSSGGGDRSRALTAEGRREIRKIGLWMRKEKFRFDLIATSPLVRARETAGIVARVLDQKECLEVWDELAPGGDPDAICCRAMQAGEDAGVLLVGHEPDLSGLIGRIITGGNPASVALAKGGCAKIRVVMFEKRPSGELQWLLRPSQMIAM